MELILENEDTTNPVEVEDDAVLDQSEVEDDGVDSENLDQSEEPEEGQLEDDTEEVNYEGQKYKVPKALKDSFLRQADYTRKTQELAEERRAVQSRATEIQQQAAVFEATAQQRANLTLIDQQLKQMSEIDWNGYDSSDPEVAAWLSRQSMTWQQLRDAKASLEGYISQAETEIKTASERLVANAVVQADGLLSKEVEGWSPELANTLMTFAENEFGVTRQDLRDSLAYADGTPDTRTFKVLARLHKAETELAALKSKQAKSAQAEKLASVQPARSVGGKTSGYKPGLDDSLPADEWLRRRNAQVAKAARR
jgi:hypothetical protein